MRRTLLVRYINRSCVEFSGWETRQLYRELVGRPPVYNTRSRMWVTTPSRIDDLIALAGIKGYGVNIEGEPLPVPVDVPEDIPVDVVEEEAQLW